VRGACEGRASASASGCLLFCLPCTNEQSKAPPLLFSFFIFPFTSHDQAEIKYLTRLVSLISSLSIYISQSFFKHWKFSEFTRLSPCKLKTPSFPTFFANLNPHYDNDLPADNLILFLEADPSLFFFTMAATAMDHLSSGSTKIEWLSQLNTEYVKFLDVQFVSPLQICK
jgi:hypothetical protein